MAITLTKKERSHIRRFIMRTDNTQKTASKAKPKQQTRMKKLECFECGFMCRTTQKHIDALPNDNVICPSCGDHSLEVQE